MRLSAAVLLSLLLASPAAFARIDNTLSEAQVTPTGFAEFRTNVETELRKGEMYSEISGKDRACVLELLESMGGRLASVTTVDELDKASRMALYNEQEELRVLLSSAESDSRVLCTREKKLGSHRTTTMCKTVAERRRDRETAENVMRTRGHGKMLPPSN